MITIIKILKSHTKTEKKNNHKIRRWWNQNKNYIDKIVVSNKFPFAKKGIKYFLCYKNVKRIKNWCIFLPNMTACRKDFDETK